MLERENAFYTAHQAEFREKYPDKWLVITGESLWGVYDKIADAAKAALGQLEPGKILIHRPSDDGKVIEIGPRIRVKFPEDAKRPKPKATTTYTGDNLLNVPYAY